MELIVNQRDRYSVVRFPVNYQGDFQGLKGFKSLTWTSEECSVVALTDQLDLKGAIAVEEGWSLIQVTGVLDFALTGILTQLANPLAEAGISIFALSTYNTDYLLVKATEMADSIRVLKASGHRLTIN